MISDLRTTWDSLRVLTTRALAEADDITVVVVLNRKEVLSDDTDDRATEYMSDLEANELITGFREGGFRTRYYEGESAFLSAFLQNQYTLASTSKLIVYNIAQSGTDPGRKSLIPSFCALHGIPTCNSNSYAVSLARHKLHVHALLRRFDLPTADTWSFDGTGWLRQQAPPARVRLIAKAAHESASIGLDRDSLGVLSPEYEAILAAKSKRLGQAMVVQALIPGREFEVPTVEIDRKFAALGPVGITLAGDENLGDRILSYDEIANDGFGFAPDSEDQTLITKLRAAAAGTCEVLGLNGFARVDFRVADDGDLRVIDVATSPHIVRHSSYWAAFKAAGWEHPAMLACMIGVNGRRLGWFT